MTDCFQTFLSRLRSNIPSLVEEACDQFTASREVNAIPHLVSVLTTTTDTLIRNRVAIALRDLEAQQALPALINLIFNPALEGKQGTLVYALQTLDCREYMTEIARIICEKNFECQEMALQVLGAMTEAPGRRKNKALQLLKTCLQTSTDQHRNQYIKSAIEIMEALEE